MRLLTTILTILICSFVANARLELTTDTLDFGTFHEENGKKTVRTYVVNAGEEPTSILRIKASCGCTATTYSKDVVNPGDSAWIDVTYNPRGRIGTFEKGVKIYDVDGSKATLTIKGKVISTPETLQNVYPIEVGGLYLTERTLLVPDLKKGDSRHVFISAYNGSDKALSPRLEGEYDEIETAVAPETIQPGETAAISFYIRSRLADGIGYKSYQYKLIADDENADTDATLIEIKAEITE